ncbi:scarecrow-like protein 34 [Hordeum vulgare]|nr:scarecrow-like protein 34 [Hordeum vulgare]
MTPAEDISEPGLFLDLPPMPSPAADVDLDFISRMLMEEDIDDKFFYRYPDQPAIVDAQRPYEQIISDITTASSGSPNGTTSSDGNTISSINAATTSSSEDTNYSSWPYDPLELSQLLRSPPYLDDIVVGGFVPDSPADEDARNSSKVPAAGFQQSPAQFKGAADGASANGGSPGTQNSAILNGPAEEKEAKPKPTMFSAGDGGQGGLPSAFFSNGGNMEMLNNAFLKGMEEGNKFLPTDNTLLEAFPGKERGFTVMKEEGANGTLTPGNGRGRRYKYDEDDPEAETARSSKLMMPDNEETGAREMFDEIMLEEYEMCMQGIQELRIAMDSEAKKKNGKAARGKRGASEAVDLRTMLIHCAQAVAAGDRRGATELLKQIKQHSGPTGDATQRLALLR